MLPDAQTGALRCACGARGQAGDDGRDGGPEAPRAKSGNFCPSKYWDDWLRHIRARERVDELAAPDGADPAGEGLVRALRAELAAMGVALLQAGVEDMRTALRRLRPPRTALNKNVPKLLLLVSGVGPPDLPADLCARGKALFERASAVEQATRADDRVNRDYYPYRVYKILEILIEQSGEPPARRREMSRVLFYIHLQSDDTLASNDREWRRQCAILGVPYQPTRRVDQARHSPLAAIARGEAPGGWG